MIPFVIIGHPRSGSTLLREALAQHPRIKVYGELFHPLEQERKRRHFVRRNGAVTVYYHGGSQDAAAFLQRQAWNAAHQKFDAVGFKLFSERIECPGTARLLSGLKDTAGLRVVHIQRHNLLDIWVSRRKAEQSGVWREPVKDPAQPQPRRETTPLEADPQALQRYFENVEGAARAMREELADAPCLEIGYDRLSAEFQLAMDEVFRFLSVEPMNCRMTTKKQNAAPHSAFIRNYPALKAFFSQSRYAGFFSE